MASTSKPRKSDLTQARVLDAAILLFTERDFAHVSIADIGRAVGIAPQGIYRYFKDKTELYQKALARDIDLLHEALEASLQGIPLPTITGALWRNYSSLVSQHPLARKAICARNLDALNLLASLVSTQSILKKVEEETVLGQKHGLYRQDLDVPALAASLAYFITHVELPLIWDEKYATKDWFDAIQIIVNALFYPVPDFSSEEKVREIEDKIKAIVAAL